MVDQTVENEVKGSAITFLKAWGGLFLEFIIWKLLSSCKIIESPVAPTALAALISAQHIRPPQFLPLSIPPVLLLSSYLNLSGNKIDAAGTSAAWSALYLVLARRRKQSFMQKWGVRGVIRGTTMGLCVANLVGGGFVYAMGRRSKEVIENEGGNTV